MKLYMVVNPYYMLYNDIANTKVLLNINNMPRICYLNSILIPQPNKDVVLK